MKLSIISHPQMGNVRSTTVRGEIWFVAKDICDILGIRNNRDATSTLDEDEKRDDVGSTDTLGRTQNMTLVNESGMYSLIFQSRKAEAKAFRKWVTSEVLPAIRQHGFYIHPSALPSTADVRKITSAMHDHVKRYVTGEDVYKCAKKFRVHESVVRSVLLGWKSNNEVMIDLQERAVVNCEKWSNAYGVERMKDILKVLSK